MEKKINLKMLSEKVNQLVSETGSKMGETVKKYNPLFPEVYFSENFHVPNMIVNLRRQSDNVCKN